MMNERHSPKRQQAELAFARISCSPLAHPSAQSEHQIFAAERQAKTARLREQRIAKGLCDADDRSASLCR